MKYLLMIALLISSSSALAQWQVNGKPDQPGLDHAVQDEFATEQISTTDPEELFKDWAKTTAGVAIATQAVTTRNQPIFSFIVFRGCRPNPVGHCDVSARFEILDPQNKPYSLPQDGPVWQSSPPPLNNLQLSVVGVGLRVKAGELLGNYRVIAKTTDHIANITLTTELTLRITETPFVDGWSEVPSSAYDTDVQAAVNAMLAKIPIKNAKLARIETAVRQIASGTNYRLTLRLADGTGWLAELSHKPDGTYGVSTPIRVK